ncbi:peroxiredoxin [Brevundimonas denitrificans]|uniref:peroxiredoxin n=1 Tax=Brevundimonas denitrificans TaxID=1443434 RepID=UPI00352E0E02
MTDNLEGSEAPAFDMATDNGGQVSLDGAEGSVGGAVFLSQGGHARLHQREQGFLGAEDGVRTRHAVVVGVSKDPVKKLDRFKDKHELNVTLASDDGGDVCERYGVWGEKMLYGRKFMGIERATFLIDPEGKVRRVWRKVKVPGHAQAVLDAVKGA